MYFDNKAKRNAQYYYSLPYLHYESEAATTFYRNMIITCVRDSRRHVTHSLFIETGMMHLLRFSDPIQVLFVHENTKVKPTLIISY